MRRERYTHIQPGHPPGGGVARFWTLNRWLGSALLWCWAFAGQGQSGTLLINYDLVLDQTPPLQCRASLASRPGFSVFYWNNTQGGSVVNTDDFGGMQVQLRDSDPIGTVNIVDTRVDSLYTRGTSFNNPYLLVEPLPRIEWDLEAETRQLGGLSVHKARARFRGRDYTAWYCPEIPAPVGPWKLYGLPGAILEAYDDEGFFHAVFTGIKRTPDSFQPDPILYRADLILDLEGFRDMQQNMAGELIRKIRSKLPRGAQLSVEETTADFLEREFDEK